MEQLFLQQKLVLKPKTRTYDNMKKTKFYKKFNNISKTKSGSIVLAQTVSGQG